MALFLSFFWYQHGFIPSMTVALVRMPVALTYSIYTLTSSSQATSHHPTIYHPIVIVVSSFFKKPVDVFILIYFISQHLNHNYKKKMVNDDTMRLRGGETSINKVFLLQNRKLFYYINFILM